MRAALEKTFQSFFFFFVFLSFFFALVCSVRASASVPLATVALSPGLTRENAMVGCRNNSNEEHALDLRRGRVDASEACSAH